MKLKINKLLFTFCLAVSLLTPSIQPSWGSHSSVLMTQPWDCGPCTLVSVGDEIYTGHVEPSQKKEIGTLIQTLHRPKSGKRLGDVGELTAREFIEKNVPLETGGNRHTLTSIRTLFSSKDCDVEKAFKDTIDDIFVALDGRGNIIPGTEPVFHEAKYNDKGVLKLRLTKETCQQLSTAWLEIQLTRTGFQAQEDTNLSRSMYGNGKVSCTTQLHSILTWLLHQVRSGSFLRTASVLDQREIKIYSVQESGKPRPFTLTPQQKGWFGWTITTPVSYE